MKKVLILAYDFPPYVSVGGLRPYNWYIHFRKMGIEPVVVTRQWNNRYGNHLDYIAPGSSDKVESEQTEFGTVLYSPYRPNLANRLMLKYGEQRYRLIRKIISAWYELSQWFLITGPKAGLYKAAVEYLNNNGVDAIIATGDPFVLFRYASKLSSKHRIPWIADYRDPWSHNYEKGKQQWLYPVSKWIEKKHVHSASAITTVSEFLKYKILQLHPHIPIHILPNGYNPVAVEPALRVKPPTDRLRFGFAGTIYDWHPWKSIIRVFDRYQNAHPDLPFEINFYGINKTEEVQQEITQYMPGLISRVYFYKKMPNDHLLLELGRNHVMLLFNYYSYMGTKIFDYLGIRRLMLLCYSQDEEAIELKEQYYNIKEVEGISKQLQADLITNTHSGIVVKDATDLYQVLENLFIEFQSTGNIACHSTGVENYSRAHQVQTLAELVKEISK